MADKQRLSEISTENANEIQRDLKKEPQNVRETEMMYSMGKDERNDTKTNDYDEIDLGIIKTEMKELKDEEVEHSNKLKDAMKLGEKSFMSMSCQTDENANYIMVSYDSGTNDNDTEVEKKSSIKKESKLMQSSFCQTDDIYESLHEYTEKEDEGSYKNKVNLGELESKIIGNVGKNTSEMENIAFENVSKNTSGMESNKLELMEIVTSDDANNNNEKLDQHGELIDNESVPKDEKFNERKLPKEGQLKMTDGGSRTVEDKKENDWKENREVKRNFANKNANSIEMNNSLSLSKLNFGNTATGEADTSSNEMDRQLTAEMKEAEISKETNSKDTEQGYDNSDILNNFENALQGNEPIQNFSVNKESNGLPGEVSSEGDGFIIKIEKKDKDEFHQLGGGTLYETIELNAGKSETNYVKIEKQHRKGRELDYNEDLQQPESVCIKKNDGLASFESNEAEEQNSEKEMYNDEQDSGYLNESFGILNEPLVDKERKDISESEVQHTLVDKSSDGKASVGVEKSMVKSTDMQRKEDNKLNKDDNETCENDLKERKGDGTCDGQVIVVLPEETKIKAKEKYVFIERSSKGTEENLSATSAMTNEKGGEKEANITILHEDRKVSVTSEDYGEDANFVEMEEMCKQGTELDEEESIIREDEIKSSKLDNAAAKSVKDEQKSNDYDFMKELQIDHEVRQKLSSVPEVKHFDAVKPRNTADAVEKTQRTFTIEEDKVHLDSKSRLLAIETQDEQDDNDLRRHKKYDEAHLLQSHMKEVETHIDDTKSNDALELMEKSGKTPPKEAREDYIEVKTISNDGHQYFNDDGMDDTEVQTLMETGKLEEKDVSKKESLNNTKKVEEPKDNKNSKDGRKNEFEVIECLISESQTRDENIREAIIIRTEEKECQERPISIGEARIISPKHQKQVHFEKTEEDAINKYDDIDDGHSMKVGGMSSLFPSQNLTLDLARVSLIDSSIDGGSCSPSGASVESEFSLALKEKDKLQNALTTVKNQYEDLLKEFDRIIENNSKESSNENIQISKESYNIALKCKEELEMEIRRAREQLAIVQAAHDSLSEDLTWHSSDYEFSEDSESISFEVADENRDEPTRTSTPLPHGTVVSNRNMASTHIQCKNNSVQTDSENIGDFKDVKEKKPMLQERGTNTSPESEAGAICPDSASNGKQDFSDMKTSDLQRLPATLPRRKGQKRRPKTLQLDELGASDIKWVSRRSLVNKEQAKKNEKLTLQAIENAELKKELLLTKLEKIRLEAMLSCVMMRAANTDVDDGFRKISLNSITSSTSTLRSTTSLTNIAQNDPTSPVSIKQIVFTCYIMKNLLSSNSRKAANSKAFYLLIDS